ncbi:MAG: hypothetical protein HY366_02690, partial [Candidatus Aenigmarchaeota archaeon]|nr:hypothetical protein [Candidatus Aenigmarchaeota archaeon]
YPPDLNYYIGRSGTNVETSSSGNIRFYASSGDISFDTVGTRRVTLLNNGNVGIGTANPQWPLDVVGEMRFLSGRSGGPLLWTAGQGEATLTAGGSIILKLDRNRDGFSKFRVITDSGRELFYVLDNAGITKVGVNTAGPAGTLDVAGSLCISGDCKSSWSQVAGNPPAYAPVTNPSRSLNTVYQNGARPRAVYFYSFTTTGGTQFRVGSSNPPNIIIWNNGDNNQGRFMTWIIPPNYYYDWRTYGTSGGSLTVLAEQDF